MTVYYLYQLDSGKNLRIEENQEITIGRAFDNKVVVDDPSVSRHHAVIRWKKGQMYLTDLKSTNGTNVNGERVTDDYYYELNYSDEVTVGNVRFKILDEESVIGKNFADNKMPPKTVVVKPDDRKKS